MKRLFLSFILVCSLPVVSMATIFDLVPFPQDQQQEQLFRDIVEYASSEQVSDNNAWTLIRSEYLQMFDCEANRPNALSSNPDVLRHRLSQICGSLSEYMDHNLFTAYLDSVPVIFKKVDDDLNNLNQKIAEKLEAKNRSKAEDGGLIWGNDFNMTNRTSYNIQLPYRNDSAWGHQDIFWDKLGDLKSGVDYWVPESFGKINLDTLHSIMRFNPNAGTLRWGFQLIIFSDIEISFSYKQDQAGEPIQVTLNTHYFYALPLEYEIYEMVTPKEATRDVFGNPIGEPQYNRQVALSLDWKLGGSAGLSGNCTYVSTKPESRYWHYHDQKIPTLCLMMDKGDRIDRFDHIDLASWMDVEYRWSGGATKKDLIDLRKFGIDTTYTLPVETSDFSVEE